MIDEPLAFETADEAKKHFLEFVKPEDLDDITFEDWLIDEDVLIQEDQEDLEDIIDAERGQY